MRRSITASVSSAAATTSASASASVSEMSSAAVVARRGAFACSRGCSAQHVAAATIRVNRCIAAAVCEVHRAALCCVQQCSGLCVRSRAAVLFRCVRGGSCRNQLLPGRLNQPFFFAALQRFGSSVLVTLARFAPPRLGGGFQPPATSEDPTHASAPRTHHSQRQPRRRRVLQPQRSTRPATAAQPPTVRAHPRFATTRDQPWPSNRTPTTPSSRTWSPARPRRPP